MAVDIWIASKDVTDVITTLIANFHPDLALISDEIAVLFREKASKSGGRVVLGKTKKAPSLLSLLGGKEYRFILELAADEWKTLDGKQQTALLDHLLCQCSVEEDEKSGDIKYTIKSPDLFFFSAELERHGNWRPNDDLTDEEKQEQEDLLFVS
tara:strand:+ start:27 stop:488 length:462 start_codon:yes stop_codon:yes gene_type:complete